MALVIDASVAIGWLLPSQADRLTAAAGDALASDFGWVPGNFGIEVAHALRQHERLRLIAADAVDRTLLRLRDLPLKQDTTLTLDLVPRLLTLARSHSLRVADATYLDLALRLGLPLATRDEALARAAIKAGARLFIR
jgi:predicted nucleic acid-binding protein